MTFTKHREVWIVRVEATRREYVDVQQRERGDDVWYDGELIDMGYALDWPTLRSWPAPTPVHPRPSPPRA